MAPDREIKSDRKSAAAIRSNKFNCNRSKSDRRVLHPDKFNCLNPRVLNCGCHNCNSSPAATPPRPFEEHQNNKTIIIPPSDKVTTGRELDDDTLMNILSRLKLRDVVTISSASKDWLHLPGRLTKITLDSDNMAKDGIQLCCPEHENSFSLGITKLLEHYSKLQSATLSELVISYCLDGHKSSKDINNWISLAVQMGVQHLSVHLKCMLHHNIEVQTKTRCAPDPASAKDMYMFSFDLLNETGIKLETLSIDLCVLGRSIATRCTSLQQLQLIRAIITKNSLHNALLCCPNLKMLLLHRCTLPSRLIVASDSLTFLEIDGCFDLSELVLESKILTTLKYIGVKITFNGQQALNLTQLAISLRGSEGVNYIFKGLHLDFPMLSELAYISISQVKVSWFSGGPMSAFSRLKVLALCFGHSCEFSFPMMLAILKECPILTSLYMVPPHSLHDAKDVERPVQSFQRSLRIIRIEGFCGSKDCVNLVRMLIEASLVLEQLVVDHRKSEVEHPDVCDGLWHNENNHNQEVVKDMLLRLMKRGTLTFI